MTSKRKPRKPRAPKKTPEGIQEVTTVETKSGSSWTKIIQIKYIKELLCPGFLDDNLLMFLASIPLIILIIAILWKVLYHE